MLRSLHPKELLARKIHLMRRGYFPALAALLNFVLATMALAESGSEFTAYRGQAAGSKGEFLYTENHVLKYEDGHLRERVVLYQCPDGAPFARKTATYTESVAPDFVFEDSSNGVREGVRTEAGSRTVFFRAGRDAAEKTARLKLAPNGVIDAGFDEFIHENWQSLLAGRTFTLQFLIPSRLSGVDFHLRYLGSAQGESALAMFRLEVAGFLKWIAPTIEVSYSADDHGLVRYEGLSSLRDPKGENLRATITFRAADRRRTDSAAFTAAMQAAIAPCRG
jgi:hypothetical protein